MEKDKETNNQNVRKVSDNISKKRDDIPLALVLAGLIISIAILISTSVFEISGSYIVGASPNVTIKTNVTNNVSLDYDVQNPLSTNGDSVYFKDLITDLSDPGNFTITILPNATKDEILRSMVSDVFTEKKDDTSNPIKTVMLAFQRPVLTSSFGIDSGPLGNFSNVKIFVKQGQEEFLVVDESGDDTKYNIRLFSIPPLKFSELRIEYHTTDTVTTGLYGIFKNIEVASRIQAISDITGTVENINSFKGALLTDQALVHTSGINEFFRRDEGTNTTLSVNASADNVSVIVTSSVGFTVGDEIVLFDTDVRERTYFVITNIAANVITLNRPIDNNFSVGDNVKIIITNMAEAGTLTSHISYKLQPPVNETWQITRFLITMLDGSSMDDGSFGGRAELPNGLIVRSFIDGEFETYTFWQKNSDFKSDMFNVEYADKAPAGQFGLTARWTLTASEFVAEIDGSRGDYLEILNQDGLNLLDELKIKGQGRLKGE